MIFLKMGAPLNFGDSEIYIKLSVSILLSGGFK